MELGRSGEGDAIREQRPGAGAFRGQRAGKQNARERGCCDTRHGHGRPQEGMPGNLKSSAKRRRDARGSGRAGAERHRLSRLGLSAGGGVVCCIAAVPGRNFG